MATELKLRVLAAHPGDGKELEKTIRKLETEGQ